MPKQRLGLNWPPRGERASSGPAAGGTAPSRAYAYGASDPTLRPQIPDDKQAPRPARNAEPAAPRPARMTARRRRLFEELEYAELLLDDIVKDVRSAGAPVDGDIERLIRAAYTLADLTGA